MGLNFCDFVSFFFELFSKRMKTVKQVKKKCFFKTEKKSKQSEQKMEQKAKQSEKK